MHIKGGNEMEEKGIPPGQGKETPELSKIYNAFLGDIVLDSYPGCFGGFESNSDRMFLTKCDTCHCKFSCERQKYNKED